MVWGIILGNRVICPLIFNGNVTLEVNNDFIINHFNGFLEKAQIPADKRNGMIWMQDKVPAHRANIVFETLNQRF